MITTKDVRQELADAKRVVDSNASVDEKLKAILKVLEVGIKVGLSTRISLVRVMEHLKVEKVQSRRPKNAEEKTNTKE
jgi:hypothetical protein